MSQKKDDWRWLSFADHGVTWCTASNYMHVIYFNSISSYLRNEFKIASLNRILSKSTVIKFAQVMWCNIL